MWAAAFCLALAGPCAAQAPQAAGELLASSRPHELAPLRSAPAEPDLTFRKELAEVHLTLTATDERNRTVADLEPGQFTILDDGKPVTTLTDFHRESDLPLDIGLVIDASDSTAAEFAAEKMAAIRFVRGVLRPESDRAFVEEFGTHVAAVQDLTGDRDRLVEAIQGLRPLGLTSLYDAVLVACRDRFALPGPGPVRRAVVLLSDGEDSYSMHGLGDVILAAQQAGVTIYAIAFHPAGRMPPGDRVLTRLTQATGGRYFVIWRPTQLQKAFSEIESELRSAYSISYVLTAGQRDGRYHQLQVRASSKVRIRARSGYLAPEP